MKQIKPQNECFMHVLHAEIVDQAMCKTVPPYHHRYFGLFLKAVVFDIKQYTAA